jgi:hypothetical protein
MLLPTLFMDDFFIIIFITCSHIIQIDRCLPLEAALVLKTNNFKQLLNQPSI